MTSNTTPKKRVPAPAMRMAFYRTDRGGDVVRAYLRKLPKDERRVIGDELGRLERFGLNAPGVDVKWERGGILALRSDVPSEQRVLMMVQGGVLWVLYAFQKDDQKLLNRHRAVAEKRMAEILGRK